MQHYSARVLALITKLVLNVQEGSHINRNSIDCFGKIDLLIETRLRIVDLYYNLEKGKLYLHLLADI